MNTTQTASQTDRQYYYRPLKFDGGQTLKCAGFGAENQEHRDFYVPMWIGEPAKEIAHLWGDNYLPGVVILKGYHGDKISREYADANKLN